MNIYLAVILTILIGEYLLNQIVEYLNLRHLAVDLPKEFADYYDARRYNKSQAYLKANTSFGLVNDTVSTVIILVFILLGGFNFVDRLAGSFGLGCIATGLIFAGILLLAAEVIGIPFAAYHTFVIEEKYGFNRTTVKTFILDILKGWLLTAVIGGIIFSLILWFFQRTGYLAWIYCWLGVTFSQLFLTFIAPVLILPIFNKFIPLEEGELKQTIENYARRQNFKLSGVFKMDGSRRSTKSNAFFVGFGKYRRIVLFDTLIEKHTVDELVSVLAHEMGHYRKKHVLKFLIGSVVTTGLMFFILSFFINNPGLFAAFQMEQVSVYAGLFFFGFLYVPISLLLGVVKNIFSRKYEYEADRYAVTTYKKPESMISALKKLSADNLSNLTPHPLKVFIEYSHPPVLERIRAIKEGKKCPAWGKK
ncbi:MAG: M48 family metallopeptidase [Elusimicrobiota bacterium]